jgi:quercetin dioxygenase-like cupin family protein
MVKNLAKLSLLVSVLLIAACSKSEPEAVSEQPTAEPPPTAEPSPETATEEGGSGDPTVLDPDHYMTEFENDAVRIVRIKYGAGEESVMHYHPDSVAVFLTDIQAQMTLPDGSTADIAASAGEAVFNSAGEHLPKNSSDSAWEVVEVELKPRDSAGAASDGPDATVVDADHYTTEFENESVRIVRIAYGAGEASVMHYHPDSVAVFVTDHLVQMTMPDGSTEEIAAAAGDAIFIPGGQHLPKNVADSGWELVLIELK